MAEDALTCRACGGTLELHETIIGKDGLPHAGRRDERGRFRSCSEYIYDDGYIAGRVASLETIIRSLRWRAGRLRNTENAWNSWDLAYYTDNLVADRDRLLENSK